MGWAEASAETALQPAFSFCPVLPLTFPHTGAKPWSTPLSLCISPVGKPPPALQLLWEPSLLPGSPLHPLGEVSWVLEGQLVLREGLGLFIGGEDQREGTVECEAQHAFSLWF